MYKKQRILGLIPAREGSKGLPGKNIRLLLGKPLIAWTIEQARGSKYIDEVLVSTDSNKIAGIARRFGAVAPFLRPEILATASAKVIDVILHAIEYKQKRGDYFDVIVLLQPTSPLRSRSDIDQALEYFFKKKAQAVISVCEAGHHPFLMNTLPLNGNMKNFLRISHLNKNRQDFPVFYRINGAIYLANSDYLKENKSFLGKDTYAYIMPQERSIDIDNQLDFDFASFMKKAKSGQA